MVFLDWLRTKKKASPEDGNPALVKAMHEIALADNPDNRKKLYQALLQSMLLVPVPETPKGLAPGLRTAKRETQFQLTTIFDRNNARVTPAFTDAEALRNWDPNTPYLGLKAQDLFRLVMGTEIQAILINPFDPIRKMIRPGGRVTRAELDVLANGIVPNRVSPTNAEFQLKAEEKVAIGLPAKLLTSEIQESLAGCAENLPEIHQLFLFQMATQSGGSHTVIGIGLNESVSREQQAEIASRLGKSVQGKLDPGQSLDFTFPRGPFAEQARAVGKQIFGRAEKK